LSQGARIATVDRLECRLVQHRWEFAERRADEIDRFWRARVGANPTLYDGRVLLACRVDEGADSDGRATLFMNLFETRFSRFLAWREFGAPDEKAYNCFAMPALRSADGAFLVGEMNAHHSSAGALYFPAGTPDPSDVREGHVDMRGSLIRELAEEAGLSAQEGVMAPGWTIVFDRQRVACMKIIDHPQPAAAILWRVKDFIAREETPELADVHMIFRRGQLDDRRLPAFMTAFLAQVLPA
jgi:8-oxo-dGTP pyrophosphatase MutT (NUDIX family)